MAKNQNKITLQRHIKNIISIIESNNLSIYEEILVLTIGDNTDKKLKMSFGATCFGTRAVISCISQNVFEKETWVKFNDGFECVRICHDRLGTTARSAFYWDLIINSINYIKNKSNFNMFLTSSTKHRVSFTLSDMFLTVYKVCPETNSRV